VPTSTSPTQTFKPCRLCGGANLRVASGSVKPCKSADVAAIYAMAPKLPCGSAFNEKAA
jgi:hypothetical protein